VGVETVLLYRSYHGKMERIRKAKKVLDCCRSYCGNRRSRLGYWMVVFATCCVTLGCSTLKSSLITGAATTAVVGVASALTPSAIVPAIAGGVTAATASAMSAVSQPRGEPITVTADTVVQEAPANFWTLLGQLIEMGGWALILIVIVPMVFSWLMPGPIQFKKKKNG